MTRDLPAWLPQALSARMVSVVLTPGAGSGWHDGPSRVTRDARAPFTFDYRLCRTATADRGDDRNASRLLRLGMYDVDLRLQHSRRQSGRAPRPGALRHQVLGLRRLPPELLRPVCAAWRPVRASAMHPLRREARTARGTPTLGCHEMLCKSVAPFSQDLNSSFRIFPVEFLGSSLRRSSRVG